MAVKIQASWHYRKDDSNVPEHQNNDSITEEFSDEEEFAPEEVKDEPSQDSGYLFFYSGVVYGLSQRRSGSLVEAIKTRGLYLVVTPNCKQPPSYSQNSVSQK